MLTATPSPPVRGARCVSGAVERATEDRDGLGDGSSGGVGDRHVRSFLKAWRVE
jgi:hypothetical protein